MTGFSTDAKTLQELCLFFYLMHFSLLDSFDTFQQCWGSYFESKALQATNNFTVEEVKLKQSCSRETQNMTGKQLFAELLEKCPLL